MASDDGFDELAVKEYNGGSVTVKDDSDNDIIYVQVDGVVEFEVMFPYGDGIAKETVSDPRGYASRDAKIFSDGVVRTLREEHGFSQGGGDE